MLIWFGKESPITRSSIRASRWLLSSSVIINYDCFILKVIFRCFLALSSSQQFWVQELLQEGDSRQPLNPRLGISRAHFHSLLGKSHRLWLSDTVSDWFLLIHLLYFLSIFRLSMVTVPCSKDVFGTTVFAASLPSFMVLILPVLPSIF